MIQPSIEKVQALILLMILMSEGIFLTLDLFLSIDPLVKGFFIMAVHHARESGWLHHWIDSRHGESLGRDADSVKIDEVIKIMGTSSCYCY